MYLTTSACYQMASFSSARPSSFSHHNAPSIICTIPRQHQKPTPTPTACTSSIRPSDRSDPYLVSPNGHSQTRNRVLQVGTADLTLRSTWYCALLSESWLRRRGRGSFRLSISNRPTDGAEVRGFFVFHGSTPASQNL